MEWEFLKLLQTFGPSVGIICFFLYRDMKRENRFMARIESLESYQKDTLAQLVERSTIALDQSTNCLRWIGRIVKRSVNNGCN